MLWTGTVTDTSSACNSSALVFQMAVKKIIYKKTKIHELDRVAGTWIPWKWTRMHRHLHGSHSPFDWQVKKLSVCGLGGKQRRVFITTSRCTPAPDRSRNGTAPAKHNGNHELYCHLREQSPDSGKTSANMSLAETLALYRGCGEMFETTTAYHKLWSPEKHLMERLSLCQSCLPFIILLQIDN